MKLQQKILFLGFLLLSSNSYAGNTDSALCEIVGGKFSKNVNIQSLGAIANDVFEQGEYSYIANIYIKDSYHYMINSRNKNLLPIAEMLMMTGSKAHVCTKTNKSNNIAEIILIGAGIVK